MENKSYLVFIEELVKGRKTPICHIKNRAGEHLGLITFYPAWRHFVFEPEADTLFDAKCLAEITEQICKMQFTWQESFKK